MVGVNALANLIPLNGHTTGEISNKLNVLITPAPYAFMIWGFIYAMIGIWLVREIPRNKRNSPVYTKTSFLFVLSCLFNACWIIVWHYEQIALSVIIMIFLFIVLLLLYKKIKFYSRRFFAYFAFSVYFGWISVASLVNINYYVKHRGWNVFSVSDTIWTIFLLCLTAAFCIYFRIRERDWLYSLVIIWSFIAIGIKNMEHFPLVAYTAYVLAVGLFIFNFFPSLEKKKGVVHLK